MTRRRLALGLAAIGLMVALSLPTGLLALAAGGSARTPPRAVAAESPKALPGLLEDLAQINKRLGEALDGARRGDLAAASSVLSNYFDSLNKDMVDGIKKLGPDFLAIFRLGKMNGYLVAAINFQNDQERMVSYLQRAKREKETAETALLAQVRCTVNGTPGSNVLKGTNGTNVMCGNGGDDKIDGKGGPDILKGGGGKDTLQGGKGSDLLVGGKGKDTLIGGPGDDTCAAGKGDVQVRCGKGPPCEAGSYTSPVQGITVQSGESKLLWFATPIPNYFYYFHRGFDSGGCDDLNGKLVANMEVFGSEGKVVAYRYDEPPEGSDKVENGKDCPVEFEPGVRSETCYVFAPQLGFNAKDANDVKTYSVAVGVQNARGDGGAATASLKVAVTWRPKQR